MSDKSWLSKLVQVARAPGPEPAAATDPTGGLGNSFFGALKGLSGRVEPSSGPSPWMLLGDPGGARFGVRDVPEAKGSGTRVKIGPGEAELTRLRREEQGDVTRDDTATVGLTDAGVSGGVGWERTTGEDKATQRTEAGAVSASFDLEEGASLSGSTKRRTGRDGAAGDHDYSGSARVSDAGVALKGQAIWNDGHGARGVGATIDTTKDAYGANAVWGKGGAGATVYAGDQRGAALSASYGDVGGGLMYRAGDGKQTVGANVQLGKKFGLGGVASWSDDEWFLGVNARYAGFGASVGRGGITDRRSRDEGPDRASVSREDAEIVSGGLGLGLAELDGMERTGTKRTLDRALPADWASRSGAERETWRRDLDADAGGIPRWASEVDLDAIEAGDRLSFERSVADTVHGEVSLRLPWKFGAGVEHRAGNVDTDEVSVAALGSGAFEVGNRWGDATSGDTSADASVLWGAVGGSARHKGNTFESEATTYRADAAGADAAQTHLREGLPPGWERHPLARDYLAATRSGRPDPAIASMREQIARETLDVEVGEELAPGVTMTRRERSYGSSTETKASGRFLFWTTGTDRADRTTTTEVDELGADGVERTELESRGWRRGRGAEESVDLLTTTKDDGPAFAFRSRSRLGGEAHLRTALNAGRNELVPGESDFAHQDADATFDVSVALSRDQAGEIARAAWGADDEGAWMAKAAERVATHAEGSLFRGVLEPINARVQAEGIDALGAGERDLWLQAFAGSSLSQDGNLFDAIPALEAIDDPRARREAYEALLLKHRDDPRLESADLGAEFLAFAGEQSAVDLAPATTARTSAAGAADAEQIPAEKLSARMKANLVLHPDANVGLLATAGPARAAGLLAENGLDAAYLWKLYGDDVAATQRLMDSLRGTAVGGDLAAIAARTHGPRKADTLVGVMQDAIAEGSVGQGRIQADGDRRAQAIARNTAIDGTSGIMVATLREARADGGLDRVNEVLAGSGTSLDALLEKAQTEDLAAWFALRALRTELGG